MWRCRARKTQDKRSLNCEKNHVCKGVGIYYKIVLIVKMLLAAVTARVFLPDKKICDINRNQLTIALEL